MMRALLRKARAVPFAGMLLLGAAASAGELHGTLAWGERVSMGSLVSGMVSEVPVRPGQRVGKGELLVALDDRGLRAELAGAKAEAARAEVLFKEAQLEDERATELYERTVLSEHERTQATIALRRAQAERERARAKLVQARLDQERSRLLAPFDGRVLEVHVAVGEAVVNTLRSEPLVELAADTRMQVRGTADLPTARALQQVRASVEVGGRQFAAESVTVGFEPVGQGPNGPHYAVSVNFIRTGDLELRAGEPARVVW